MNVRQHLLDLILAQVASERSEGNTILDQLGGFPLGVLCDISEASLEFIGNRAVYTCGPARYFIVLWQEAYAPQEYTRRQDSYAAAPMVMSDLPAYNCPITGKPITSRSKHRENLKMHGCEVAEPSTPRSNWQAEKREDHDRKKAVYDAMNQLNYH